MCAVAGMAASLGLAGCVEAMAFGVELGLRVMVGGAVIAGERAASESKPNAKVRLVKAELLGEPLVSGAELTPEQCRAACAPDEARCWHVAAYAPPLSPRKGVPTMVCGDGAQQTISDAEFDRLEPLCKLAKLEPRYCAAYCPAAEGAEPASCRLRMARIPSVEIVEKDERLVVCEQAN